MAEAARLDGSAVDDLLTRLDTLLERLEATPGPAGELGVDAVSILAKVYGEALARAVSCASGTPDVLAALTSDELIGHLMVLHDIHPEPVERRIGRALDRVRPALREHGMSVELDGIRQGVATVRIAAGGCGSSAPDVGAAVREAVRAVAPELSDVVIESSTAGAGPAFVPIDTLGQRPEGLETVR